MGTVIVTPMSIPAIKTHDSESQGQEEAGRICDKQVSYLHIAHTTLKLVNALNNPPLKLLLSYQGFSTLGTPILSTSHCKFYDTHLCAHT